MARSSGFFSVDENMSIDIGASIKDSLLFRLRVFCALSAYALLERAEAKLIPHAVDSKNLDSIGRADVFDNSVVATRTVITEDVPPDAVVGGLPAMCLKRREQWWISKRQSCRKCASSIFMEVAMKTEHKIGGLLDLKHDAAIAP